MLKGKCFIAIYTFVMLNVIFLSVLVKDGILTVWAVFSFFKKKWLKALWYTVLCSCCTNI